MKQIVVVGGGISGISAALELLDAGEAVRIELVESAGRLGGVLETIRPNGYLIERSADNFATLVPEARDLSQKLGILPELIHPNQQGRQAFVFTGGRLQPIPAGFSLMQPTRIGSILTTGTLSLAGKMRLLKEYFVPARLQTDDESLESFAIRRLGQEAFERLVEPIVSGIFTADPKTLSMAATMPQFLHMERTHGGLIRGYLASRKEDAAAASRRASGARYDQFMAPREGMSSWIQALAGHLPSTSIHLETSATEIKQLDGYRWLVRLNHGAAIEADGVILATPAATTARLLEGISAQASSLVRSIPYASSAVVAMVVDRKEIQGRLDGFGVVVPSCEKRKVLAISFSSNKYPGRTPDNEVLLRVFLGGSLHPEILDLDDQSLQKMAASEVHDILRWSGLGLKWQAVIRWENAMPQYLVGHVEKVQQIEQTLERFRTIRVCGAAFKGVGIPQCVRSGQLAARQLIDAIA